MTQDTFPPVVRSFRSPVGRARIAVLADGRAIRYGITGAMLFTSVGGDFVRYLTETETASVK